MGHCVITCKDVKQGRTLVLGLALYESKHTHIESLTVAGITSVCCSSQMFRPILKFVCVNFFIFLWGGDFFFSPFFHAVKTSENDPLYHMMLPNQQHIINKISKNPLCEFVFIFSLLFILILSTFLTSCFDF